jgi:hypothetical protein
LEKEKKKKKPRVARPFPITRRRFWGFLNEQNLHKLQPPPFSFFSPGKKVTWKEIRAITKRMLEKIIEQRLFHLQNQR